MNSPPDTHPASEVLRNFSRGTLDDAAAATLVEHLEACESCRVLVSALGGNTFLDRLRAARAGDNAPEQVNALSAVPAPAGNTRRPGALTRSFAAAPVQPADAPPALRDHKDYQLERELGRGGMGVVYLVFNREMRRREVLKVMNQALASQPDVRERFLRELRAAARLNHTNVATAYATVPLGDAVAFTMEYVEGDDLEKIVARAGGALPVANACYYLHQAALGLQHAHEKGLVHRDLKPNNLILAREGKKHVVKIVDFGLAKVRSEQTTTNLTGEQTFGTPTYMAPEQWRSTADADIRSDIYSLGCTLHYLLTGEPPFPSGGTLELMCAHQFQEPKPLNELRRDVPAEVADIARKMLAKDPAQRYQKPSEVAQALLPFFKPGARLPRPSTATQMPVAMPAEPPPEPGQPVSWEEIGKVEPAPRLAEPKPESLKAWRVPAGIAAGLLLLSLACMWAAGVFRVKTAYGTIVLENVPADAEVTVDGGTATLKPGDGNTYEISVTAGPRHRLEVRKGFKVFGEEVVIEVSGGQRRIPVRLEPVAPISGGDAAKPPQPEHLANPLINRGAQTAENPAKPESDGFVSLFNGKDLTNWQVFPPNSSGWEVKDGMLIGKKPASFLWSDRGDYENFRFRIEARIKAGVAGQFFRAAFSPVVPRGFEAQINSQGQFWMNPFNPPPMTGSLFEIDNLRRVRANMPDLIVPPDTWFTQEVTAVGNRITIAVKGVQTVEHVDRAQTFRKGHFALHTYLERTVVEIRKIEWQPLPMDKRLCENHLTGITERVRL